jgi:hypothetical protein
MFLKEFKYLSKSNIILPTVLFFWSNRELWLVSGKKKMSRKKQPNLMTTFAYCYSYYLFYPSLNDIFFCREVDDYNSAVSASLTHLQFVPDSEDMINNLDYYR